MDNFPAVFLCVLVAATAFDFVNGFHDAANSIATIVATRVLKPWQAVLWAAAFNVLAVFFFGSEVAKTVGSGLIALDEVSTMVILAGLIGATTWGLITWRLGLPTSSSHALLGGYAGAAMAYSGMRNGWVDMAAPIIAAGWIKTVSFIVIAPLIGLALAYGSMRLLMMAQKRMRWRESSPPYRYLQLVSSACLSLMHGSNDAQKTAGIVAGAMLSAGMTAHFMIPHWVLGLSYGTMGMGTLFGGWRIVRTMGSRLTKLTPPGGVCAESASALAIMAATFCGAPISTTHVTTGAILGVGAAHDPRHVRWRVGRRIAWAWILTIPAAAVMGFGVMLAAGCLGGY